MTEQGSEQAIGPDLRESQRLALIEQFGLLDITGDPQLDTITQLAARITGCSMALVSIVGSDAQHFIANLGMSSSGTPREVAFCNHTIKGSGILVVKDAQAEELFRGNPLVTGDPRLRFYAGVPLALVEGCNVGTLCVLDTKPHTLDAWQREQLELLARLVVDVLRRREQELAHEDSKRMLLMLKEANEEFIGMRADRRALFDRILTNMLSVTRSAYGFIGEVLQRDGQPYLKTHAITNIAWNKETRDFYEQNAPKGMEFTNLRTLFGHTLSTGEPVISNKPATDSRRGGLPSGHPALNHYLGIPIKDSDGAMIGMVGLANKPGGYSAADMDFLGPFLSTIATLITAMRIEQARVETELHNRLMAERLQEARTVAHMGDSEFLLEGMRLTWSDEMYGIFELPRLQDKELVDALMQRIHPDDVALVVEEGRTVLQGSKVDFEYRIVLTDGRIKNLMAYRVPMLGADGQVVGIRGTDQDITDRRRSEDLLLRFFDVSDELLCVLDKDDRFLVVGRSLAQMLGSRSSALIGTRYADVLAAEDGHGATKALVRLRSGSARVDFRARVRRPGDAMVEWSASLDPSTNLVYAMGKDIAVKEQLEQALWTSRMEAEKARAKDVFIANVSHEIRTPLNAIIGFADLLGRTALGPDQRKHLEVIDIASRNLSIIINDILDLAKMDGGKLELEHKPLAIEETVRQVVSMHAERARAKGIRLLVGIDQGLPSRVVGDHTRLTQILMNLVSNALKFTEKGQVRLDVVEVMRDAAQVRVRFDVTDTGIGIEPAKLNLMFERFTQAESYTTRVYGGTGLGLNIVRSLVELHGGELAVESVPGEGSTFSFELAYALEGDEADVAVTPAKMPPQPMVLQGVRILLVEDNEHNQILASTYLERNGAVVDVAVNGMAAIQQLASGKPDLILMDIQMPVMDGIQTTEVMRKDMGLETPIVACSAHALSSERQRCIQAGMNDYLTKPYTERSLVDVVLHNLPKLSSRPLPSATSTGSEVDVVAWYDHLLADLGTEAAGHMRASLLRNLPRWVDTLSERLNDRDLGRLHFDAHNIAGGLGAMRLLDGHTYARACELHCAKGAEEPAFHGAAALRDWLGQVRRAVERS